MFVLGHAKMAWRSLYHPIGRWDVSGRLLEAGSCGWNVEILIWGSEIIWTGTTRLGRKEKEAKWEEKGGPASKLFMSWGGLERCGDLASSEIEIYREIDIREMGIWLNRDLWKDSRRFLWNGKCKVQVSPCRDMGSRSGSQLVPALDRHFWGPIPYERERRCFSILIIRWHEVTDLQMRVWIKNKYEMIRNTW